VDNSDYYCDNSNGEGIWVHRTKHLIDRFMERGGLQSDFEVSCAKVEKNQLGPNILFQPVLNIWWDEKYVKDPNTYYDLSVPKQFAGYSNVISYCSYQDKDVKAIGLTLNTSVSSDLFELAKTVLNISDPSCIDPNSGCTADRLLEIAQYGGDCNIQLTDSCYHKTKHSNFGFYYNATEKIMIVSNNAAESFSQKQNWFTMVFNMFMSIVSRILGLGYDYYYDYRYYFPSMTYSDAFYYGKYNNGAEKIFGYGETAINKTTAWQIYITDEWLTSPWYNWYIEKKAGSRNYQYVINMTGFDSGTISSLNNTIRKLCDADKSKCFLESLGDTGEKSLFIKLSVANSAKLFKENSQNDYSDYFGLFTRNLRVKRFD